MQSSIYYELYVSHNELLFVGNIHWKIEIQEALGYHNGGYQATTDKM